MAFVASLHRQIPVKTDFTRTADSLISSLVSLGERIFHIFIYRILFLILAGPVTFMPFMFRYVRQTKCGVSSFHFCKSSLFNLFRSLVLI